MALSSEIILQETFHYREYDESKHYKKDNEQYHSSGSIYSRQAEVPFRMENWHHWPLLLTWFNFNRNMYE